DMQHELFRYATPGIVFLVSFFGFFFDKFGGQLLLAKNRGADWIGLHPSSWGPEHYLLTPLPPAVFVTVAIASIVPVGWFLYNAFRFCWALLGDFEDTDAMNRMRERLKLAIRLPDGTFRYTKNLESYFFIEHVLSFSPRLRVWCEARWPWLHAIRTDLDQTTIQIHLGCLSVPTWRYRIPDWVAVSKREFITLFDP